MTNRIHGIALQTHRFVVAVARRLYNDNCLLHASALAYVSLLSLVPLFALMFAVLKGLGVQHRLEPLLLSRLALDPDVAAQIVSYIDRTNVGTLGALGAAALVLTVVSVLGSVETSFNHIWRVRRSRSWWRKASDYLSTVLLTPLLLLAAVAITSSLQEQALLRLVLRTEYVGEAVVQLLRLLPIVMNAVALMILYAVMPNRRPHVPAILVGAVIAGCAWQLVQWAYITLQVGVAHYNAIYGALSQLPVLLVWLYLSWSVVLAGAELAAVYEFGTDAVPIPQTCGSRWAIALHLLLQAAERFRAHGDAVDPRATARQLKLDADVVLEVVEALEARGLLAAMAGNESRFMLARDPGTINLAELEALMDATALPTGTDPRVQALFEELTAERQHAVRPRSLADVLDDARSGES